MLIEFLFYFLDFILCKRDTSPARVCVRLFKRRTTKEIRLVMLFMCLVLLSRVCFTDPSLLFVKAKKANKKRQRQWRGKEKNNNVNRYITQFDKEIIILHF